MIPILLAALLGAGRVLGLGEAVDSARRSQPQLRQARALS